MQCLLNTHNEWDPLNEVIIGKGIPDDFPAGDFTFKLFFHDNIFNNDFFRLNKDKKYSISKQIVEEHNRDIEQFVDLLVELNIAVHRPKTPTTIEKISCRSWDSQCHPALNCRDLCFTIGNKIIETPVNCRWRYFETDYMKHIFHECFLNGAEWICAPRPLILESSFDLKKQEIEHINRPLHENYLDYNKEIMFDAANCLKFGTHVLMNVSNDNQRLGLKWLKSILGPTYTVWDVNVAGNHIDSTILPVRPGLAVVMKPDIHEKLPQQLQDWDLIYIPTTSLSSRDPYLASPKIMLNFLSVSPDCVICNHEYARVLQHELKPYGVDVIAQSIRHSRLFSGGHHCVSLDINRTGELENYFS